MESKSIGTISKGISTYSPAVSAVMELTMEMSNIAGNYGGNYLLFNYTL